MNFFTNLIRRVIPLNQKNTVSSALGLNIPSSDLMSPAISLWSDMYQNCAPWLSDTVHSLNLPAGIASELSRLVTVDMVSEVKGSPRAELLNSVYQTFLTSKKQCVELACAKGGVILRPVLSGGELSIDFVQPDNFIPVSFDSSGNLISAVFVDRLTVEDSFFSRLEYHRFEGDTYIIENRSYKSSSPSDLGKEVPLDFVSKWQDLSPVSKIVGLKKPLFAYFKMPYSNTIDPSSPLGISAYAGVCDLIREADKQYSRLLWEFESGERAVYLDNSAFTRDRNGKVILPNRRLYRTLNSDESLFNDWSPALRDEPILNALNSILRKIEFGCGLSYGTISDEISKDRTAEEIRSTKQRSYSTVCDIQIAFRDALTALLDCTDAFISLYNLAPKGDYSVSFSFDDSIIADRQTEFQEKLQLLNAGILLPYEFRTWYFGEDEETAKSILN